MFCDLTISAYFYLFLFFTVYIILAFFVAGNSADETVTVLDSRIPVIYEHPLDVIVGKGEPATLNCAARGPDVNISWYKDDKFVRTNKEDNQSHRLILRNGALFLLKVNGGKNESDAGNYYCVAKNAYGSARSREASLKIALLLDDFKIRPRGVQAILGQDTVLECSPPHGFPEPIVSWRKNEQEFHIEKDSRITLNPPGNLVFSEVDRKDAGMYQCVATNVAGEKVSNPVKLSVYEKPYFQVKPKNLSVEVGKTAKFDCRASGDPMPSISWKKRDGPMPVGRAYISKGSDGLTIEKVEVGDKGEYICIAKNQAGTIEESARLDIFEQPQFLVKPEEVTVERGGTAFFNCKAKGHPDPALFWLREGQQELYFPGSTDGRIKILEDARLVIRNVEPSDAGYYICSTLNAHGSNLARAALKVVSKTLVRDPPPVIVYGPANQTLAVGSPAFLPCQATGRSPTFIKWFKDDQMVHFEDNDKKGRFNQSSTGSLRISELRLSDSGIYTCQARSRDGETTWTASLVVQSPDSAPFAANRMPDTAAFPSAPGTPIIKNVTDNAVCMEWTIPDSYGSSLITSYMLQYFSPDKEQTWYNLNDYIRDPNHCVKGLTSSESYVFIVRAENSKGLGPPSEISEVAYTSPRVNYDNNVMTSNYDSNNAWQQLASKQLVELAEVRTVNSTAVEVFWKTHQPDSAIDGYYIQWRRPGSPDINYMKVSSRETQSAILNGLKPYTDYDFFVIPYHGSSRGRSSNSLEGKTDEAPPSEPPPEVRVRMMNLTTLRISWQKPPQKTLNGVCVGYQVNIIGGGLRYSRNITTNERAASVTLFHLEPNMSYTVKVAARTKAGIGVFRQLDPVLMNEQTLQEHKRLMHSSSGMGGFLQIFEKPWFIPVAAVLIWLILVGIIAFIYWKWRSLRGKSNRMPFIKINDGSVQMSARDAMWMGRPNFSSTQRSLLLSGTAPNGNCGAPPVYTQTPHNTDYYIDGQITHGDYPVSFLSTINRSQSPNHYHYASLSGNPIVSNFCGTNQIMDDPSPYATTTLVLNNRRKWMQEDGVPKPPVLPSNPVPSGPPPRYLLSSDCNTMNGRRSANLITHPLVESRSQGFIRPDSPPHTDVTYVQSSDGTGGSSNARLKIGTLGNGRRTPPKQTLMDFLPPPPLEAPPPESSQDIESPPKSASIKNDEKSYMRLCGNDLYDAVSENLLPESEKRYNHSAPLAMNRPNSRLRTGCRSNGAGRQDEDDSQRSSLMMDENGCAPFCSSSEADEENSESEVGHVRNRNDVSSSIDHVQHRPLQPCMGISASTLSQNSYQYRIHLDIYGIRFFDFCYYDFSDDGCSVRRSISRLKQPPQRGVKNELV
uniref:Down syndrome cell adhesion molecule-like protein Dscam2 n=1 Tax=Syphacia muris TaxID=451379 RepID=A0A0N5AAJ1_9BILA